MPRSSARSGIARVACLAVATAVVLTGCQTGTSVETAAAIEADPQIAAASGGADAVNQTCSVSGKPVESDYNLTYKGETIGFCSAHTQEMFVGADAGERDAWLEAAKKNDRLERP